MKVVKWSKTIKWFYYSRYKELLQHKCLKIGVKAIPVNPAYTSQIGHTVFMKRYGLSSHGSAACVIARRGMDLTFEKVPYACPLGYPKNESFDGTKNNGLRQQNIGNNIRSNKNICII